MAHSQVTLDGNEAAAWVAHRLNEVIAIYPITPSSPMGELADAWSNGGQPNLYGLVPTVIEMQSEGGAAGAVHGALQTGALATTFTASQGLLLMIPNMFKIAGELTPAVFHVAARTIATHALSIFGDHSDVMAVRSTGWALLCSSSVQEAHDFALVAQAATLASRVPFLHFFDGFRTSHEINKIAQLEDDDLRALVDDAWIAAHRARALNPERPVLRGSAQNPDVFFQAREAANPFYDAVPELLREAFAALEARVGRRYDLFDYVGHPEAERVLVLMGSGCGAAEEAVAQLVAEGQRVGLLKVRLFRPFSVESFVARLPATTARIAVLDRTKEPGAIGEPLYQDVVTALAEGWHARHGKAARPRVVGGRYGLSSKEFTPAMVAAVLQSLAAPEPKNHFTIGIVDDVTQTSLRWDPDDLPERDDVVRAVFFGLGSDGTVGANKNTVKIVGERTPLCAQGYFVYDSKKSGSVTISHLRFSPRPILSTYLIRQAQFVACHQFHFLERLDVLSAAAPGATFLLNSPYAADEVWDHLPREVQDAILAKRLRLWVVNADAVARQAGLGGRINTVMQACFFRLAKLLPGDEAFEALRESIRETYGKRGAVVVERNLAALEASASALAEVRVPDRATATAQRLPAVPEIAPDFVQRVTARMIAGDGDLLPVSALPVDGTFPTGTTRFERRGIAREIPIWDPGICIQCGLCALVCPHAAIRMKAFDAATAGQLSDDLPRRPWTGRELPPPEPRGTDGAMWMTIQVAPDDCTGCGVCVDVCPAKSKEAVRHKAINMEPRLDHLDVERRRFDEFLLIPEADRGRVERATVKGSQLLEPLFEFSGACAGCGETPYLKLLTQLFGERMIVANATGCSSIYGGNLPTTPWARNAAGRGPAWSNSLFEDNAEFGLGMRLAIDSQRTAARQLLAELAPLWGAERARAVLDAQPTDEAGYAAQQARVAELRAWLAERNEPAARRLWSVADALVDRSVWIVGGDGWAYDIGFGGLDHVLASGRNVNVLVLDTEVYSNTGGQASKATPRAAIAKFAAGGKAVGKKDLGMIAMAYGNVYVARIAVGAQPLQTVRALVEAETYPGPALVIAYSQCIAHGIDMTTGMTHQKDLVNCGYWPLYRYDPRLAGEGQHPFHLDSRRTATKFRDVVAKEARFAMLAQSRPDAAGPLLDQLEADLREAWHFYEQLANVERSVVGMPGAAAGEERNR